MVKEGGLEGESAENPFEINSASQEMNVNWRIEGWFDKPDWHFFWNGVALMIRWAVLLCTIQHPPDIYPLQWAIFVTWNINHIQLLTGNVSIIFVQEILSYLNHHLHLNVGLHYLWCSQTRYLVAVSQWLWFFNWHLGVIAQPSWLSQQHCFKWNISQIYQINDSLSLCFPNL